MNIKCSFIIFYKTWLKLNTETGHEISMLNYEPPNKRKHAQDLNLFFPPPKKISGAARDNRLKKFL